MYKNLPSKPSLGLLAWITSGLGLLIIAALIVFTLRLSNNFQQEIAYNKLESSLSDNDFYQAKKYSSFLLQKNNPTVSNQISLDAVLRLASNSASDPTELLPQLQRSLKELEGRSDDIEEISVSIENEIQQIIGKQEVLDRNTIQYQELEMEKVAIEQRFSLLASDLYTLLNVDSQTSNEIKKPEELQYYQEGILANLPLIEGLEDGIPDTSSLSEALYSLNEVPDTLGGVSAEDFVGRINQLRSSSLRLIEQDKNLESRSKELEKEQRRLEVELEKTYDKLAKSTGKLVLVLSEK